MFIDCIGVLGHSALFIWLHPAPFIWLLTFLLFYAKKCNKLFNIKSNLLYVDDIINLIIISFIPLFNWLFLFGLLIMCLINYIIIFIKIYKKIQIRNKINRKVKQMKQIIQKVVNILKKYNNHHKKDKKEYIYIHCIDCPKKYNCFSNYCEFNTKILKNKMNKEICIICEKEFYKLKNVNNFIKPVCPSCIQNVTLDINT